MNQQTSNSPVTGKGKKRGVTIGPPLMAVSPTSQVALARAVPDEFPGEVMELAEKIL